MIAVRLDRRMYPRIDPSDVVQETLLEAAQKLTDYFRECPVPFYPWLRRMAWENLIRLHEKHVKAARRSVVREVRSLASLPDPSAVQLVDHLAATIAAPDRRLIEAEIKTRVMKALGELPDLDREILILRYLEQLPGKEIAQVLKISESAARQRHGRAIARMAKLMNQDRHGDEL